MIDTSTTLAFFISSCFLKPKWRVLFGLIIIWPSCCWVPFIIPRLETGNELFLCSFFTGLEALGHFIVLFFFSTGGYGSFLASLTESVVESTSTGSTSSFVSSSVSTISSTSTVAVVSGSTSWTTSVSTSSWFSITSGCSSSVVSLWRKSISSKPSILSRTLGSFFDVLTFGFSCFLTSSGTFSRLKFESSLRISATRLFSIAVFFLFLLTRKSVLVDLAVSCALFAILNLHIDKIIQFILCFYNCNYNISKKKCK